ncbi:unnamed protein product [Urochloa decumbens]|uniref:F-box protein AT5G49610-like beta-propeller domain-containing protein n=1 Tax=Urochloa decumbens TaxID=240449 RepID=A0ABC9D358_9POAL
MALPPRPSNISSVSLADNLLAVSEILVRLSSPADLIRAALASRHWLEAASSKTFLQQYRARHPSSPLLGLYVPRQLNDGLPSFHLADSVRSDPALSSFAYRGDFDLAGLESHPKWSLLDCNGGRLLLSDGKSLVVYDPSSSRCVAKIPPCHPWNDSIAECLLRRDSDDSPSPSSFGVVCVQHCRGERMVRAVEYDSHTRRWRNHQCAEKIMRPERDQAMHAGRLNFWRYKKSLLLVLDTTTMGFSIIPLPCAFFQPQKYAIGDTEDGGCCLVGLVGTMWELKLQVWLLQENGAAKSKEPDMDVPVSKVNGLRARVCQVHVVSNGLAFLWSNQRRQFVVDLKKMCLKVEFECLNLGYPLHMPWPPALLVETRSEAANGVVDVEAQNILAVESSVCSKKLKRMPMEKGKNELVIASCELGNLQVLESAASTGTSLKRVEGFQRHNDEDHDLSVSNGNTESVTPGQMIATQTVDTLTNHVDLVVERIDVSVQLDPVLTSDDPCDPEKPMATEVENLVATSYMEQIMAVKVHGTMEIEETEVNKMVGIHDIKMVCDNKITSHGKLDDGGEMSHYTEMDHVHEMVQIIELAHSNDTVDTEPAKSIHSSSMVSSCPMDYGHQMICYDQMDIHGNEAVQGIRMIHGNGTIETALPNTSEHFSVMAPTSELDHGDEMIHCNQIVMNATEIIQGIEMTCGSDTAEAPLTTSTHSNKMNPNGRMDHCGEMIHHNKKYIHDREMVQGIEIAHDNGTVEGEGSTKVRSKRKTSFIWEHFSEVESDGCTTHLRRHVTLGSCPVMKVKAPPLAHETESGGKDTAEKPSKRRRTYAGNANDGVHQDRSTAL